MSGHGPAAGPAAGAERFRRLVGACQETKALFVAARLGVFNALRRGPMSAAEVASALDAPAGTLGLLLDALAGMELLEKARGRYTNSPDAERYLADGGPESVAPLLRHQDRMWARWTGLEEKVRGRAPAPDEEAELRDFLGAMAVNGRIGAARVLEVLDLGGVRRLLDLGGGPGSYAAAFARRWPGLSVTLFDHPESLPLAREALAAEGLAERVELRGGDLFEDDPGSGYDAVWASNLVHSYPPDRVRGILSVCRRALAPGGRLVLHDFFLDAEHTRPRRAAVFALHMLVVSRGGRTYSYDEMEEMLAAAGFGEFSRAAATEQSGILSARRAP